MARNRDKYIYAELAIPRNAVWYPLLLAEAEVKGLPLPQVALERLAASYLAPGQLTNSVVASASAITRQLASLSSMQLTGEVSPGDDAELELSEERAANNAAAFLDNDGSFF
jgi:hypothetical protein